MDKYECKVCGKQHDVLRAIEIPDPEDVLQIPDSEIETRVKNIGNNFIIDDEIYLLQGDIFIYKNEVEEPFFRWSVWVSIPFQEFIAKAPELKEGKNVEFNGTLETALPFYDQSKGLRVKAIINIDYEYAVIKVQDESQLKIDQVQKIDTKRVLETMQLVYHPPGSTNNEKPLIKD